MGLKLKNVFVDLCSALTCCDDYEAEDIIDYYVE